MAEKLVSRLMMSLGADVARRDPATEEMLAASVVRRVGKKLLSAIRNRDADEFTRIVTKGADEVGFDIAFDLVMQDALDRGLVSRRDSNMLRTVAQNAAGQLSVEHRGDKDEYFVTFVVPVHGPAETLDAAFADGSAGKVLASALRNSGFVTEGVEVAFLPSAYDPRELTASGPAAMRYATAAIGISMLSDVSDEYVRRSARTLQRRLSGGESPAAPENPVSEYKTVYAVGGYYRTWRPEDMTADALLMSAGKYDDISQDQARRRDQHVASRYDAFSEEVAKSVDFEVGPPALPARASSQAAFDVVLATLVESARSQGLIAEDARRLDPEDMVYFVEEGSLIVLARFGDDVANSYKVPYWMVSGDIDYFRERLGYIHPSARPMEDSYDPEPSSAAGMRGPRS